MVSNRCTIKLQEVLQKLNLNFTIGDLGVVYIMENLTPETLILLKESLLEIGLELMEDKNILLLDTIKKYVIEMVYFSGNRNKLNFSSFLSSKLGKDYHLLSHFFSEIEGTTIEQFIIHNKVERIKELIKNDELTITEIAFVMNYSSVSHLSTQFKKTTDLSPSQYKKLNENHVESA